MKRTLVTIAFAASITLLLPSSAYADESSVVAKEWKSYVDPLAPLAEHAAALAPGEHDEQWRQNLDGFLFSDRRRLRRPTLRRPEISEFCTDDQPDIQPRISQPR